MKDLTQKRLREMMDYDPDTGLFRWREAGRGQIVGAIVPSKINADYHRVIYVNGLTYAAHRLAWLWYYGTPMPKRIKHINGDTEDNRIDNLKDTAEA